ncbi:MAG TPA: hypothetical protein VK633_08610, partial [Verrucomicrobiae bacterium]|nr:hypothetical protein [Verrucomicrobiae bacterium]
RVVMRTTGAKESRAYGETILKLLERIPPQPWQPRWPVLVGILEEKQAAQDRLRQIAEFSKSGAGSWRVGGVFLGLLTVAGLSNAQSPRNETPRVRAELDKPREEAPNEWSARKTSAMASALQSEYVKQAEKVREAQTELDRLRGELNIGDWPGIDESVREMKRRELSARAQYEYLTELLTKLKSKSRIELRQILPSVAPDAAMNRYLGDLAQAEQKYASLDFDPKHPEMVKLKGVMKIIGRQIEDRIDGVLEGMQLQAAQAKAMVGELEAKARPDGLRQQKEAYFEAKRKCESEQRILDILLARILQDKSDGQRASEAGEGRSPIEEARLLIEAGKLEEAEAKLRRLLAKNPDDRAARYYFSMAQQKRKAGKEGEKSESSNRFGSLPSVQKSGRQAIVDKLRSIVLPRWSVAEATKLSDVIRELHQEVVARDPKKTGINFVISSWSEDLTDPVTGRKTERRSNKVEDFVLTAGRPLENAPVWDVLQKITETAHPPGGEGEALRFSVEDYAVMFWLAPAEERLRTRTFKLNPNVFLQGIESITGKGAKDGSIQEAIRTVFAQAGVNFELSGHGRASARGEGAAKKAVFFNERTGVLMVRATEAELEIVEGALQALNTSPPQVTVETKILRMTKGTTKEGAAAEIERLLGMAHTNGLSAARADELARTFPRTQAAEGPGGSGAVTGRLDPLTVTIGILTEPQTRDVWRALEKNFGPKVVSAPKVTTLSSRQARIAIDPGPTVDVLAVVNVDGRSITLTVEAEVPEGDGPLPGVKLGGKAVLWDGQTLALWGRGTDDRPMVVLVTPTIIDPAGNRVHSAETLPPEETIPPQERSE